MFTGFVAGNRWTLTFMPWTCATIRKMAFSPPMGSSSQSPPGSDALPDSKPS